MAETATKTDFVLFVAATEGPQGVGAEKAYGKISDFSTRKTEDVAAEWDNIVSQLQDLLGKLSVKVQTFPLQEVVFELGFSAGPSRLHCQSGSNRAQSMLLLGPLSDGVSRSSLALRNLTVDSRSV